MAPSDYLGFRHAWRDHRNLFPLSSATAHLRLKFFPRTADSSSTKAVSFSSARTTKRFPSPRCASAIQIVRPWESTAETQSQLHPAFLRFSAMIPQYFCGFLHRSAVLSQFPVHMSILKCLLLHASNAPHAF